MILKPKGARQRTVQDRSKSMSATTSQAKSILSSSRNSQQPLPSPVPTTPTTNTHSGGHRRTPIVYPALLSRVAEAFRVRVTTAERVKDDLTYKDAFDGREAVDKIAYIIKTTDRCLALLLGRALDAQKFFHDVTYDHRLRDNANELYQFRTRLASPFVSGEDVAAVANGRPRASLSGPRDSGNESSAIEDGSTLVEALSQGHSGPPGADNAVADEDELPSGVFTLLTDCYSPTCTRDRLCYSIACPRRLEQQSRLNLKQEPGLKRSISRESLGDFVEPGTLWVHSVPQEVVDSVSDTEKKRQEAINEVIYTERDFVRDMEYLRDVWMKPLQTSNVIPEERRHELLSQVFWNITDIISVNVRLRDALNKRQKSYAVVEKIGDILLDAVPHFAPFVDYGSHQLYGKYEFEKEKNSNPAFAQFVEVRLRYVALAVPFIPDNECCLGCGAAAGVSKAGAQWLFDKTYDASSTLSTPA
jgi:RHO1 GDP-GTP exchange protein 1/2